MPELAEVEFFRKEWDLGLGEAVTKVAVNERARVFRRCDVPLLRQWMLGACFVDSEAHGKQLLFRFRAKDGEPLWLGMHLGMTGKLFVAGADHGVEKHEHLILHQSERALVFSDYRQFGRVDFEKGGEEPDWWRDRAPAILSGGFTRGRIEEILARRGRRPIKAVLLLQDCFPGLGNWMVDEILWRTGIHPARLAGSLKETERKRLFREVRSVARTAMATVGKDFRDPPKGWLFHQRWKRGGICPKTGNLLRYETIAGRTTCWSPAVQLE